MKHQILNVFPKGFASPCGTQFEGGKGGRERSEKKVRCGRREEGEEERGWRMRRREREREEEEMRRTRWRKRERETRGEARRERGPRPRLPRSTQLR